MSLPKSLNFIKDLNKDIRALAKIVMAITKMAGKVGTCMDQLKHTMTDKTPAYKLFNQGRLLTTTGNWHFEVDELDERTLEEARVILLDELCVLYIVVSPM